MNLFDVVAVRGNYTEAAERAAELRALGCEARVRCSRSSFGTGSPKRFVVEVRLPRRERAEMTVTDTPVTASYVEERCRWTLIRCACGHDAPRFMRPTLSGVAPIKANVPCAKCGGPIAPGLDAAGDAVKVVELGGVV